MNLVESLNTQRKRSAPPLDKQWVLFALRWFYLLFLPILVVMSNMDEVEITVSTWVIVLGIAILANILLLMFILVGMSNYLSHIVVLTDGIIVAALSMLMMKNPVLLMGMLCAVLFTSMSVLATRWMVINTLSLLCVTIFSSLFAHQFNLLSTFTLLWVPILSTLSLVLLVGVVQLIRDIRWEEQLHHPAPVSVRHVPLDEQRIESLLARASGISEMAEVLGATMNHNLVLDKGLQLGRMSVKNQARVADVGNYIGVVMLYQEEDHSLYITTGIGMSLGDQNRTTLGTSGVIGASLRKGEVVFSQGVVNDPELKRFRTFHHIQSVVCVPLRAGFDNYGAMILASKEVDAFDEDFRLFLEAVGVQMTVALQNVALYQRLVAEKERIIEVQEEARKKLARDLHDGPIQTISAIGLRMGIIRKMLTKMPEKVPDELQQVESMTVQVSAEIRHMMFTQRPLALENRGLGHALEELSEKMNKLYTQNIQLQIATDAEQTLTAHQAGTLFYIVEEAVNNARKHAQASLITVRLSRTKDVIHLVIQDNGVGFDKNAVFTGYEKRGSLGMVNLRERAEMVDGELSLETAPGEGTKVTVIIPIDAHGVSHIQQLQPETILLKKDARFTLSAMRSNRS